MHRGRKRKNVFRTKVFHQRNMHVARARAYCQWEARQTKVGSRQTKNEKKVFTRICASISVCTMRTWGTCIYMYIYATYMKYAQGAFLSTSHAHAHVCCVQSNITRDTWASPLVGVVWNGKYFNVSLFVSFAESDHEFLLNFPSKWPTKP